jgi:CHASE3 domain sensor protein
MSILAKLQNAQQYISAGKQIFDEIKKQVADGGQTLSADEQQVMDELESELQESRAAHQNLKDALEGN